MSKSRDSVDAIAEAIREDEEARDALAEAVVEQMDLDDSMPEAQGAQAHRREVLKTLGLVGTGAAAGALGGTAATQEARAADTSVGQIGSDGSPVDVALDQLRDPGGDEVFDVDDSGDIVSQRGFEFPSVTTDGEVLSEQRLYVYSASGDFITNIDPSVTTTPLQDAFDAIGSPNNTNAAGLVALPSGEITESGAVTPGPGKTVVGQGMTDSSVRFTDTSSDGFDLSNNDAFLRLFGFTIDGDSATGRVGSGTHGLTLSGGNRRGLYLDQIEFTEWENPLHQPSGSHYFMNDCGFVRFNPPIRGKAIDFQGLGHNTYFQTISILNDSDNENPLLDIDSGGQFICDNLYISTGGAGAGNDTDIMNLGASNNLGVIISNLYIEGKHSTDTDEWAKALNFQAGNGGWIGHFRVNDLDIGSDLIQNPTGRWEFPQVRLTNTTVSGAVIRTNVSLNQLVRYGGPRSDMNDTTGDNAALFYSVADRAYADPVDELNNQQISAGSSSEFAFTNLTNDDQDIGPSDLDVHVDGRGGFNDVGYNIESIWYDESAGHWNARISETEGETSITLDVEIQR